MYLDKKKAHYPPIKTPSVAIGKDHKKPYIYLPYISEYVKPRMISIYTIGSYSTIAIV